MSEVCNTSIHLRQAIERYVLQIYESDGVTLKPYTEWPGYYTLKSGARIPCVFVTGTKLVEKSWNPTGVECLIEEVPEQEKLKSYGGGIFRETWLVKFTNYGAVEGTQIPDTLFTIQRRLGDLFGACTLRHKPRSSVTFELLTARIRATSIRPPLP